MLIHSLYFLSVHIDIILIVCSCMAGIGDCSKLFDELEHGFNADSIEWI